MEKTLKENLDFVTHIRSDSGILLYEDYGTKTSRTGFRLYGKIDGCKMIIYVNKFNWGGFGIDEYDYGLKDISVRSLKRSLDAHSDNELFQKLKEGFGVRDGDKLLQQFLKEHHILYKIWSD